MGILLYLATLMSKLKDNFKQSINKNTHLKTKEGFTTKILFYLSVLYTFVVTLPLLMVIFLYISVITLCLITIITVTSVMQGGDLSLGTGSSEEQEVGTGGGGGEVLFTEDQFNAVSSMLTEQEKNFYRLGIVSTRAVQGYGGVQYLSELDAKANVLFLMGISSIETGMKFYRDGSNKNILEIPSDIPVNNTAPGYGFLGLSPANHSLGKMTAEQAKDMQAAYTPKEKPMYDINYAPWATYFSLKHLEGKYGVVSKHIDKVEKVFTDWGLDFNVTNKTVVAHFMLQAAYHGWDPTDKDELDAYAHFWAMLLHITGDSNETRDFGKWAIAGDDASYTESNFRKTMFGTNMKWKTAGAQQNPSTLTGVGTKVSLNGTVLDNPIWRVLYEKYNSTHANEFNIAWKQMNVFASYKKGYGDRQLNYHYGFNSFLQGSRVIAGLSAKIGPLGGPDEGTGGGNTVIKGTFKHEPGVLQAEQIVVNNQVTPTTAFLDKYYSRHQKNLYNSLMPVVGTATMLSNPEHPANKADKKNPNVKAGLPYNTYGVPFQVQYPYGVEPYQKKYYGGTSDFQTYGCMVYSVSYTVSAFTGLNINPPETALYLHAYGAMAGALSRDEKHAPFIKAMTGKEAKFVKGSSKSTYWALAKEHLDAHRGIVVYRLAGIYASGSNHYVVLLDSHDVGGKKMYSMYSSSSVGHTRTLHSGDTLMNNPGSRYQATLIFK